MKGTRKSSRFRNSADPTITEPGTGYALGVSFLPLGSKETQTTATQDTAVVTASKLIET